MAAWLVAHPGRTLPTEYTFTTTTSEDGITSPWTGTMLIVSPQKRGDYCLTGGRKLEASLLNRGG